MKVSQIASIIYLAVNCFSQSVALCLLSACILPHFMQTRILFQSSPIFFSRKWPGDLQALAWFVVIFAVGLIGLLLYLMLFSMLGLSPVASLDPFQCS